jgi:hypothetical protein
MRIFVKAAVMKIFVFFEEMRKSRQPKDFQELVAKLIMNAVNDFVHYCLNLKNSLDRKDEEYYYLM